MPKYEVIAPLINNKTNVSIDHTGQMVGIPRLDASNKAVMNEDELRQWMDMYLADKSLGPLFVIHRVGR